MVLVGAVVADSTWLNAVRQLRIGQRDERGQPVDL